MHNGLDAVVPGERPVLLRPTFIRKDHQPKDGESQVQETIPRSHQGRFVRATLIDDGELRPRCGHLPFNQVDGLRDVG
ncbi:hypothetical protein [Paludisphaera soli]|uniref:hypothetical protein n=1 Tax=Paludisphaera soli TaxID=2712865 RepID=UPI0013EBE817|nr:hypothetical protein [Paludisphaera soli]